MAFDKGKANTKIKDISTAIENKKVGKPDSGKEEDYVKFYLQLKGWALRLDHKISELGGILGQPVTTAAAPTERTLTAKTEDPEEVNFSDFLLSMGDAILKAQQSLDQESEKYLINTKDQKHVLPTVFRIPKLSASIQFGLRKVSESGMNIILAKKSVQDEVSLDQSMQFEIQAIPPPPDIEQALMSKVPSVQFEYATVKRRELFRDVERGKAAPLPDGSSPSLDKDKLLDHENQVIIIKVFTGSKEKDEEYLLLYADEEEATNVGMWYLKRDPEGQKTPKLEVLLKFKAKTRKSENYKILRDICLFLAEQQKALL